MTYQDKTSDCLGRFSAVLARHAQSILESASRVLKCPCLPVPVFEIAEPGRFWGRYIRDAGGTSRILLNRDLLFRHSWYAVEDVLRHELAHYLAHSLHHDLDEPSHGPVFRQMCAVIGANPAASGAYPLLDDLLEQDPDAPAAQDAPPVVRKIRKLLALSESPNEHEAHLALMKARELMEKHDIQELPEDDTSNPFVTTAIDQVFKTVPIDELALANLLEDFYDVRCLISRDTQALLRDDAPAGVRTFTFSGRRSKVKIALYVRDYIRRYMAEAWNALPRDILRNGGVRERRDFNLGVLKGIRQTLEAQKVEVSASALVRRNALLDAYYHARYPRVHVGCSHCVKINERVMAAGKKAGKNLRIHPGVESSGRRQLTNGNREG